MKFFNEQERRDPREHQDQVFVFGSNLAGIHGAGAAAFAEYWYGAKRGVGRGMTGNSYAIPTKDKEFNVRSVTEIRQDIMEFLEYATQHIDMKFFVTRIGCGYAGYVNEQIAPMFHGAPENCMFDEQWKEFLL